MRALSLRLVGLLVVAFVLGLLPLHAQDTTLIVATNITDVVSFDPSSNGSSTNLSMFYTVYERLYELPSDPTQPLIPNLAVSHTVSDVTADTSTWTFQLREGVTFASGNPFTAQDVVFSWTRVANFQNEPAQVFNLFIDSIEAVDDLTLRVVIKKGPFPAPVTFFDVLTALPAFSILDSQLAMANGATTDPATDAAGEWLNQNSAGSGPFILTGWTPEAEVTLVRNEAYWTGTLPDVAGMTLRQVNDSTTALQLVERGEVDIAQNLDKDLAAQVEANPDLALYAGQGLQIIYLALSPGTPDSPLADARVRQAIMTAVDYDGITGGLLGGFAARPAGIVPVGILGAAESLPYRYERDLDAARALMAEAGYADGFDLTINMPSSPLGGLSPEILAAKLVADLGELGITVTPQIEADSVFREGRNARAYQAWVTRFSADFFDPSNWTALFTIPRFFNIAYYANFVDEAVQEAAVQTIIADDRAAAVAAFTALLNERGVYSVLYQPQSIDAVSASVTGYEFHPVALIRYAGLQRAG